MYVDLYKINKTHYQQMPNNVYIFKFDCVLKIRGKYENNKRRCKSAFGCAY